MAGTTGLEPAASAVTGQRSNQLNYVPTRQVNEMRIAKDEAALRELLWSFVMSGFTLEQYVA